MCIRSLAFMPIPCRLHLVLAAALCAVIWPVGPFTSTSRGAAGDAPVTRVPNDGEAIAVRSWLVAGMFPSPDLPNPQPDGPRRAGFDTDFLTSIGGEEAARPRAGTVVPRPDSGAVEFVAHQWKTDYVDLTDLFGWQYEVCAYLYAELESEADQQVYLHVGTNDAGKVWVAGRLVILYPGDRTAERSQHVAEVTLRAGRTPLLLKIDQAGAGWGAFVEVYGATAHRRLLDASSPEAIQRALGIFESLRREAGDPLALTGSRRDAYALALYCAEKLRPELSPGWRKERLQVPRIVSHLQSAVNGARAGTDPYTGKTGTFEAAYLSEVDGTAQPFTLAVPEGYSPERPYALLVDLHGAGGTHERRPDYWWGEFGDADSSYQAGTIGASVMGRGRWSGYQGLGEEDVLQVIKWIKSHYRVDPDRVYIRGGSMGGRGTWLIAARYPDIFAGAMADCGWPVFATLPNLVNLPTYVNHGAADWVVAVGYSRLGVNLLQEAGSPVVYSEYPGVGHDVWNRARPEGCMARLASHRRIADPARIRIHAEHPRYAGMYWGRIEKWDDPHTLATLEAQVLPGNVVSVNLTNVAQARLSPPAKHLTGEGDIIWMVQGRRLTTPRSPDGAYDILVADGKPTVRAHVEEPPPATRPYVQGSVMNLYRGEPLLIVYGTSARDDSLRKAIHGLAEEASHWLMPSEGMEFGAISTVADTHVSAAQLASKNLMLLGGPQENALAAKLMPRMPIREEQGALRIFTSETIPLAGRGYGVVYPNPEHPRRLVFVYASSVPEFYTSHRGRLLSWGVSESDPFTPDLVVETVDTVNSNRLVRQVTFTHGWQLTQASDEIITRSPKNALEEAEMTAQVFREAAAAPFAIIGRANAEKPCSFDTATVRWQDFSSLNRQIIVFEATGRELLDLARPLKDQGWMVSPVPDSQAVDSEATYRVASFPDILWDLAGRRHYNARNVRLASDGATLEALFRKAWGVRRR